MGKEVTIMIDETLLQIALIALQDAEDKNVGEIDLEKLLPSYEERERLMKLYRQYNGDPEVHEEDIEHGDQFLYANPNHFLFILYTEALEALKSKGVIPFIEQIDKYSL